jgi:hypothetical protein
MTEPSADTRRRHYQQTQGSPLAGLGFKPSQRRKSSGRKRGGQPGHLGTGLGRPADLPGVCGHTALGRCLGECGPGCRAAHSPVPLAATSASAAS